jgi:Uma2 family endonuclease
MAIKLPEPAAAAVRESMSYDEYLELAPESRIMEWVNGEGITYMLPTDRHQDIVRFLSTLLDGFISILQLGVLRFAPFEVRLWPGGPAREPDILFIGQANLAQITERRYLGGPDLIVEVISDSSVTEDRVRKFQEYERAGAGEYWIIDPRPFREQADFYIRSTQGDLLPAPIDELGRFRSTILPGFWLDIEGLWRVPLPKSQLLLAAVLREHPRLPNSVRAAYQAVYESLAGA